MKLTIDSKWLVAGAGIALAACSGKLLLDKGSGGGNGGGNDGGNVPDASSSQGEGGSSGRGKGGGAGVVDDAGGRGLGGTYGGAGKGGQGGTASGGAGGSGDSGQGGARFVCPGDPAPIGPGGKAAATTHWSGNASICPPSPPEDLSVCNAETGEICVYDQEGDAAVDTLGRFVCLPKDAIGSVWYRYDAGYNTSDCPLAQPAYGEACTPLGAGGTGQCIYPGYALCGCNARKWVCIGSLDTQPRPPAQPDATERIRDLTDAERQEWCEWYACGNNSPDARMNAETPGSTKDYYSGTRCAATDGFPSPGVIAGLSIADCVSNLAISACGATVSELNDCVTAFRADVYAPLTTCGRYFATPGCSGTIAIADSDYDGPRGGPTFPGLPLTCPVKLR